MKRNILKQIISIILASIICTQNIFAEGIHNISSVANANAEQTLTTIIVGNVQTTTENKITVPISIANNVGLIGLTLSVEYNSNVLTLTKIDRGEALTTLILTKPGNLSANPVNIVWDGEADADTSNGSIALLEFATTGNITSVDNLIDVTVVTACDENLNYIETVVSRNLSMSNSEIENINKLEPSSPNLDSTSKTQNTIPVSSNLSVTSNIKLNGVNVGENGMRIIDNGNMSCTISVTNSSIKDDSITAILATYTSDGKLHNTYTFVLDVAAGETSNTEIVYQFDAEKEYSGKLMIWNTLTNLIPIKASINFTQNSGINAYYYNEDNRLLQIDKANGKSIHFTYDNMGNLLSKTIIGGEEDA